MTPIEILKAIKEDIRDKFEADPLMMRTMNLVITEFEARTERLHKHGVSGSLPDAEIFLWLQKQKYQTEQGEQEYKMYFDVDMPKIIKAAIAHFSSGNDR